MKYHFLFLIGLICFGSCTNESSVKSSQTVTEEKTPTNLAYEKPGMIHTVYFWYKDGVTEEQEQVFKNALKKLGTVSHISQYFFGPPAATEDRNVIDNSYDMAINAFFVNEKAEAAYQIDPIHLAFIEECKDLWEKVVVYDNIVY